MAIKNQFTAKDYLEKVDGSNIQSQTQANPTADYYEMARNQEYTKLNQADMQLANARSAALKSTRNMMNASGFQGTGYGANAFAGINSAYLNRLGQSESTARSNIANIDLAEQQANATKANDRFESVTTMLSQAKNQDQMDSLLKSYNYMDDNGNWTRPEGISDDDWNQINYYYGLQKDSFDTSTAGVGQEFSYSENKAYSYDKDGKLGESQGSFNYEIEELGKQLKVGAISPNSYIKMANIYGDTLYIYYGSDGVLRYMNKEEFDKIDDSSKGNVYYINGNNNESATFSRRQN